MTEQVRNLISSGEASRLCGCKQSVWLSWVKEGYAPAGMKVGGTHFRVWLSDDVIIFREELIKRKCEECGGQLPRNRPISAKYCGRECAHRAESRLSMRTRRENQEYLARERERNKLRMRRMRKYERQGIEKGLEMAKSERRKFLRIQGSKGGKASASNMTSTERGARASKAGKARWGKRKLMAPHSQTHGYPVAQNQFEPVQLSE